MPKTMKYGPSPDPQKLRDGGWYYEDRLGIQVFQEKSALDVNRVTTCTRIPFARLIRSLKRCGYKVEKT